MSTSIEQINALNRFAQNNKRSWRQQLSSAWRTDIYPVATSAEDTALLQQLRNADGSLAIVESFRVRANGYRHIGFLKVEKSTRLNRRTGHFGDSWHIVDAANIKLVPVPAWTKARAKVTALEWGICLAGQRP